LSAHSTYCYCYRMEDWIGHDMAGYGRAGAGMKMHLPSRLPASYGSLAVPVPCTPEIGSSCDCWAWDWASASPQMTCDAELIALLTASILGVCVMVDTVCGGMLWGTKVKSGEGRETESMRSKGTMRGRSDPWVKILYVVVPRWEDSLLRRSSFFKSRPISLRQWSRREHMASQSQRCIESLELNG
jgi:hypothetical protein